MSEWYDSKKRSSGNLRKLLQERIEKANPRRQLTTEEVKRLSKLEAIADKLKRGENVQNRQLQTWLSEDEYAQLEAEWEEQLELRSELKVKPSELMPLPSVTAHPALRCKARSKRSGRRCMNPAAYGQPTCRMHGARKPETFKRGTDHPLFIHGQETLEAKSERSAKLAELREIEAFMFETGMATGARWMGRKPK